MKKTATPESVSTVDDYRRLLHSKKGLEIPSSRSKGALAAIESFILQERLQPGDPLPTENELCERLEVSRSSVREALRQLQALDIVTVHQGRGTYVGEMSLRPFAQMMVLRSSLKSTSLTSLKEVVQVRRTLDIGLAREIVMKVAGKQLTHLHQLVDTMVEKARNGQEFLVEDIEFHTGLVSELNNNLLEELMNALWLVHMSVLPVLPAAGKENMVATAKAHGAMLKAAEAGDALGYMAAVQDHYSPLIESIEALPA